MQKIIGYGFALALGSFLLHWLESHYAIAFLSTQLYTVALAILFTLLGIWVGRNLNKPPIKSESLNTAAQSALKISDRELQVLALVGQGKTNKEIARRLNIAAATVKTHLIHLNQKLEATNRTEAINKARKLSLIR